MGDTEPTWPYLIDKWGFQFWDWLQFYWVVGQKFPWEFSNNLGWCQDHRLLSTKRGQEPIAKNSPYTTHWTLGHWVDAYIGYSPLCSSSFGAERYSSCHKKRNTNSNPATNPFGYSGVCLYDMLGQWWHKACASN